MELGAAETSESSGPFLGLLIGVPLSLAVWAAAVGVALIALA